MLHRKLLSSSSAQIILGNAMRNYNYNHSSIFPLRCTKTSQNHTIQCLKYNHQNFHTSSSVVVNQVPNPDPQGINVLKSKDQESKETRDSDSTGAVHGHSPVQEIQQILNAKVTQNLSLAEACQIVCNLAQSQHKGTLSIASQLQEDPKFIQLHNLIHKGNHMLNPLGLFKAIQALESLGFSKDGYFVKELENELKWIMRRCSVRFLPKIIWAYFHKNDGTAPDEQENSVSVTSKEKLLSLPSSISLTTFPTDHPVQIALSILQRRWVEVSTGPDFIAAFRISCILSPETRDKLEDRAVEVVQDFQPGQMLKIFIALAEQNRRPTPLLRSLAFHLSKTTEKIGTKDWIDLLYALNRLTFADPVLMERICTEIHPEIPSTHNPAEISSIVTCLGQMRYNHPALVQAVTEWLTKNLDSGLLRPFDLASWVLMAAVLGQLDCSSQYPALCAKISSVFNQRTSETEVEWINIVHALCILGLGIPSHFDSVLNKDFVNTVDGLERNMASKVKLLNLNALAKQELISKSYKGPFLDPAIVTKWTNSYLSPNDANLSKSVLDSLSNFLPPPKYLQTHLKLECGVFVDGACNVNEKMDPLPINSPSTTNTNTKSQAQHQQPEKIRKLAILVQGYPVFTLGQKIPTGGALLNAKILENLGYLVLTVPYTEFSPKDKLVRRVQWLEKRIKHFDLDKQTQSHGQNQNANPKENSSSSNSIENINAFDR